MKEVAHVNRLFGSKGELSVTLYDEFPLDFYETGQPLFAVIDNLVVPFYLSSFLRKGNSGAVVVFDDIDTPKRAEMLLDMELMIDSEDEHENDDVLLEDLVRYKLHIVGRRADAQITDFFENGCNPLFEIQYKKRSYLIPATPDFIEDVDIENQRVVMRLPDGLLDL